MLDRNLIFVSGKGGVGKTVVSQAIARRLNEKGKRVLWATFEDPLLPSQDLREVQSGLFHLNCEASASFEEYATMKIGVAAIAKFFVGNKVVRYLAKAAPGIHELVLLGKVWHERNHYDSVVVDMPSTGYGLAMFQSTRNFARLFQGGPIHRDADEMLATFNNPEVCSHVIVSIPEEMPLQESMELRTYLSDLFPKNPATLLANRLFPALKRTELRPAESPAHWPSPVTHDGEDYAVKRHLLEKTNLKIWDENGLDYLSLEYEVPNSSGIVRGLSHQLGLRGYL